VKLTLKNWNRPDALVRMAADFVLLHVSMFLALAAAAVFHMRTASPPEIAEGIRELQRYYLLFFCPASPLFVIVLLLDGAYTSARSYRLRQKLHVLARSTGAALLVALAANYLLLRGHIAARSVSLVFSAAVLILLPASRCLKYMMSERFEIVPKGRAPSPEGRSPVLIVGGAGYIGSMLCRSLLEAGERVRVLDSLVYGDFAIAGLLGHPGFELMIGDCRHIQSVVGAVKGVKSIVHLAAIVGDPACEQDRENALEINYAATRMLIEIAKGHGVERFVFASSCSVYGAGDQLMDERSQVAPVSLYGQTKVDSETALLEARSETFHPIVLRLATVFGNGYRPRFDLLVNLLTAKAAREGVITIYNEQQWRPFIHVKDVAKGFAAALEAPLASVGGQIFNLGDTRLNYTLQGVAEEIQSVFPRTRVEYVSNSDRRNYRVSFDKIRSRIGFRCEAGIRDGILDLKKALEDGSVADYTDKRYHNQRFLQAAGILASPSNIDRSIMAAFAEPELAGALRIARTA
jgi:nucleoside-diphosphate-sugar epimerase